MEENQSHLLTWILRIRTLGLIATAFLVSTMVLFAYIIILPARGVNLDVSTIVPGVLCPF